MGSVLYEGQVEVDSGIVLSDQGTDGGQWRPVV